MDPAFKEATELTPERRVEKSRGMEGEPVLKRSLDLEGNEQTLVSSLLPKPKRDLKLHRF